MGGAKSFAGNLPGTNRVVAHENAFAPPLQDNIAAFRPFLPNGVRKIAVDVHVVIFHGADTQKIVKRQRIKMRDVENIGSEAKRFMMSEWLRRARALPNDAPVGLRFEDEKFRKS